MFNISLGDKKEKMYLIFIIIIGSIISIINFYISINGNVKSSGIPLLGSLLVFISLFFINNNSLFYILIVIILVDTGGLHWAIVTVIYNALKEKDDKCDEEEDS